MNKPTLKQAVYMLLAEINQMDEIESDYSEESMIDEILFYLASLSATCPFKNYAIENECPNKSKCSKYKNNLIGHSLDISCVDYEEEETDFVWRMFIEACLGQNK